MFTVYKKLTTPETSPVLGPANAPSPSPNVTPREGPQTPPNQNQTHEPTQIHEPTFLLNMEPFSLCNYCCSSRPKPDPTLNPKPDPNTKTDLNQDLYEFGHATHYKYRKHNATTPRMICEFETGTPP